MSGKETNNYAVAENKRELFQTTPFEAKEKTMKEVIAGNPIQDYFSVKYGEAYDEAEWFKARCEYLEKREESLMKFTDTLTEHRWKLWKENQVMKAKLAYLEENNWMVFREVEEYGMPKKIEGMPIDPSYVCPYDPDYEKEDEGKIECCDCRKSFCEDFMLNTRYNDWYCENCWENVPTELHHQYSEDEEQDTDGSDEDLNGAISVSGSAF